MRRGPCTLDGDVAVRPGQLTVVVVEEHHRFDVVLLGELQHDAFDLEGRFPFADSRTWTYSPPAATTELTPARGPGARSLRARRANQADHTGPRRPRPHHTCRDARLMLHRRRGQGPARPRRRLRRPPRRRQLLIHARASTVSESSPLKSVTACPRSRRLGDTHGPPGFESCLIRSTNICRSRARR